MRRRRSIMKIRTVVAGIAWVVLTAAAGAQSRPDFAGKWTLVKDAAAPDATGAFGESFLATQFPTSLIIDWSFVARGRGGEERRASHLAFIFSGAESNVSDIFSTGSHTQISDTSAWDGQKLIVTTTERGYGPPHVSMKRTFWLDADGTLIIETS